MCTKIKTSLNRGASDVMALTIMLCLLARSLGAIPDLTFMLTAGVIAGIAPSRWLDGIIDDDGFSRMQWLAVMGSLLLFILLV